MAICITYLRASCLNHLKSTLYNPIIKTASMELILPLCFQIRTNLDRYMTCPLYL